MQNAQICAKYCTKAFGGQALPGPAGGAYSAPQTLSWINGEGTGGKGRGRGEKKVRGRDGKGGRYPLLSDFLATPIRQNTLIPFASDKFELLQIISIM